MFCVMEIVAGNGHSNPQSNPGRGCLHFTNSRADWIL